jgi:hypothetical protein
MAKVGSWLRVVLFVMMSLSAQAALAQDEPRITSSFGYQSLTYRLDLSPLPPNAVCIAFCSYPRAQGTDSDHGWYADLAIGLNKNIAVVGKGGGTYSSDGGFLTNANPNYASSSIHQVLGGVRFTGRTNEHVKVFAHALGGRAMASITRTNQTDSTSAAVLNAGGGLDLMFNRNAGVRIGADYARFSFEGLPSDTASFSAGIVFAK